MSLVVVSADTSGLVTIQLFEPYGEGDLGITYSPTIQSPSVLNSPVVYVTAAGFSTGQYTFQIPAVDAIEPLYVRGYWEDRFNTYYTVNYNIFYPDLPLLQLRDLESNVAPSTIDFPNIFLTDLSVFDNTTYITFNFLQGWGWFFIPSLALGTELPVIFAEHTDKITIVKNLNADVWVLDWNFDGIGAVSVFDVLQIKCTESFSITFPLDESVANYGEFENDATHFALLAPSSISVTQFLSTITFTSTSGELALKNLQNPRYSAVIDPSVNAVTGGNLLNLSPNTLYWIKGSSPDPIPNHGWMEVVDTQNNHNYIHPQGYVENIAFVYISYQQMVNLRITEVEATDTVKQGGTCKVNKHSSLGIFLSICIKPDNDEGAVGLLTTEPWVLGILNKSGNPVEVDLVCASGTFSNNAMPANSLATNSVIYLA